eukprot:2634830-Alexandrium_andersonii.AAC.1
MSMLMANRLAPGAPKMGWSEGGGAGGWYMVCIQAAAGLRSKKGRVVRFDWSKGQGWLAPVSYTHLRAHETSAHL